MVKKAFNENWSCYETGKKGTAFAVTLPHDAMQLDGCSETSPGGVNTGWINAKDYTYEKAFDVPKDWDGKKILLEFEGVYRKATVYINDKKAIFHEYGYLGFYVDCTNLLNYGQKNTVRVEVINSDQPNSRWYTGTGIYRSVWLHLAPMKHILPEGIRVKTLDYRIPKIQVEVNTAGAGAVQIEILDQKEKIGSAEGYSKGTYSCTISIPNAGLWSTEHPNLYVCRVKFGDDVQKIKFGIRMVTCDVENGFCINGKRVLMKGACVHHDNGILGARAYDFSEKRKVRILHENGYNAIRCAHNPCSKKLLEACDEIGMLVLEEYIDGWYIHKTKYDYADVILQNYKADLKNLVDRDYNHPSVIMYSIGNEVSETAQKKGIELCADMVGELHRLDGTRPVTCGVNIFFNFLSSMGFGVYSDKKADQAAKDAKKKKAVGSEFFNTVAGIFGAGFMKFGATLPPCDWKTRDAFEKMDIAGYNYGIDRYEEDLKKYPDRLILGSETFCADAYRFIELAKKHPRIIGDFVWAGMDYLGEVGIGSWEYADYAPRFDNGCGWVSAGSGRIDLTGKPLAEMAYTRTAFGLDEIGMAVVPVTHTRDKHSPSAWKMSNAIESWSWNGCDGNAARVEVYTRGDSVKLFVNDRCVGVKKRKRDCRIIFDAIYCAGELRAEVYDQDGNMTAKKSLYTAEDETILQAVPEQYVINTDDLCYVRLKYTDPKGEIKPLCRGEITISVQGGELLAAGSACPYYPKSYLSDHIDTYYGEAQAVIRPNGSDKILIKAESRYGEARAEVYVKE